VSSRSWTFCRYLAACASLILLASSLWPLFGRKAVAAAGRIGLVQDWSTRHVIYTSGSGLPALLATQRDPRAFFAWMAATRALERQRASSAIRRDDKDRPKKRSTTLRRDWSVSLGDGTLQDNMYPAKFSFDVNATPDCVNDFAVFALNVAPGAGQANIVGLNYLYSGTSPNGICNNLVGNGTSANVNWAYQVGTKAIATSPVISLDGTQIAFVENTNPATFHVLTWTAGQGTVTSPATPTGAQLTSLTLAGGTGDTYSPPFVDYFNHVAYVGTNNGKIFKITNVFNGTPALAGAPWPLTASGNITGAVYDQNTGNVFASSRNGRLFGFNSSGTALTGSPIRVGDGTTDGGIADPPIVDSLNGFVYAMSGSSFSSGGANGIVEQVKATDFTSVRSTPVGNGGAQIIHSGDFNDAYFSQSTNQTGTALEWFLYVCGSASGGSNPVLYRVGFDASRNMNTSVNGTTVTLSASSEACSPLTEFINSTDRLFFGVTTTDVVGYYDISSSTTPTLDSAGLIAFDGGPSGIIIDNVSSVNQASSIYFAQLDSAATACGAGNFCAIKLTQSGLQ
jgi:hypothetical protein